MLFVLVSSKSVVHIGLRSSAHCRLMQARMAAAGSPATTTPSLSHATDLLRELRQAIRKVEVTPKAAGTAPTSAAADVAEDTQTVWTTNAIEAFNSQTVRKVAAARDALADARYEAEQREGDPDEVSMLTKVVQVERDLEHLRKELRKAVAARKRHEERIFNARSRVELLGTEAGGSISNRTRRRGRGDNGNVPSGGAAGDAREMKLSLQRTRKMLAEQLERVAQVSEVVGEQDALLRDTFEQHQGIGGTVRRARTTLHRLKAADVMDTVFMVASTCLFFVTVCFVMYQRLPTLGLL